MRSTYSGFVQVFAKKISPAQMLHPLSKARVV